jgi:hypothetical protein
MAERRRLMACFSLLEPLLIARSSDRMPPPPMPQLGFQRTYAIQIPEVPLPIRVIRGGFCHPMSAITAILAAFCLYPQPDPNPYPLCTPISTQGHPIHPRIAEGRSVSPKYQILRTKYPLTADC